jgi:hypothetical protein
MYRHARMTSLSLGRIRMVEHADQYGRDTEHESCALRFDQTEQQSWLGARCKDLPTSGLQRPERCQSAACCVEHWHRIHPHVGGSCADRPSIKTPVIREAAVGQHRSLGKSGRP